MADFIIATLLSLFILRKPSFVGLLTPFSCSVSDTCCSSFRSSHAKICKKCSKTKVKFKEYMKLKTLLVNINNGNCGHSLTELPNDDNVQHLLTDEEAPLFP